MSDYRLPYMERGIRTGPHISLYPHQLNVAIWCNPRKILYDRAKFPLYISDEFEAQMLKGREPLIGKNHRWSLPLYFQFYDLSNRLSKEALEWEKLQLLNTVHRGEGNFFAPWMPLVIYEAHRKGVIDVLTNQEGDHNTFYVKDGMAIHAIDIEHDVHDDPEPTWHIHARGLGEEQVYPDSQRIFIML